MLKRILLAVVFPAVTAVTSIGCTVEHRPAVTEPRYVARCPAGYRYDGNDCHRVDRPARIVVEER
jgi:hypothetical protein